MHHGMKVRNMAIEFEHQPQNWWHGKGGNGKAPSAKASRDKLWESIKAEKMAKQASA